MADKDGFKNGSFGRCNQRQRKQQHQHKRSEHPYEGRVVQDPNIARPGAPVYSDHYTIVGHELVRQYYTVLYKSPEHFRSWLSSRCPVGLPWSRPSSSRTKTGHVVGGQPLSEDRQVFVSHLSSFTTSEHLRRTFAKYGEVVDVRIMSDGYNQSGKPSKYHYGFFMFGRRERVDAELASHQTQLWNGNKVNVKPSKSRL
ncbi:hypothetical protein ACI65C_008433 [Semiaphis heraclei]